MKTLNELNATFPVAQPVGGPLSSDQIWQAVMRMSQFSHTIFSDIERTVYQGYKLSGALGAAKDITAPAEQDAGKIVSEVA